MAFRFPLAAVLRVWESIERREERALQRIQLEMARVSRQVDELSAEMAKAQTARELALRQQMPAGHLQDMLRQAEAAAERKTALLNTLRTLEQQRDKQLKLYQTAHRDHETILSMLQQQRTVYEQEQVRTQQKYLDDIFMARRHRS